MSYCVGLNRAVGSKFVLVRRPVAQSIAHARSAPPPRKILDFRPSEIVSGAIFIQPRGPATLLRVSVPSLIPSRADSGWGLSLSWYKKMFSFFFFFFLGAEHWSGGRRTCRTCSYGPGLARSSVVNIYTAYICGAGAWLTPSHPHTHTHTPTP